MQIFKTKYFNKWAQSEALADTELVNAVKEISAGLIDVSLGGCVYKKRVARMGAGKSGGFRTLIALKLKGKAFFIYGFSKNQRDNITSRELIALKRYASELLGFSEKQLKMAINTGELIEVKGNE